MPKRSPNPQLAKLHRNYTVEEIACLLDVHRNTVRQWIKRGLPVCDDRHPTLVLGRDLRAFLAVKKVQNKRPCLPGQMYCLKCRSPSYPAERMADFEPVTDASGSLIGLCSECGTVMYRRASIASLEGIADVLDITVHRPAGLARPSASTTGTIGVGSGTASETTPSDQLAD